MGGDAVVVEEIEDGGEAGSHLDGRSQAAVLGQGVLMIPS